MTNIVIDKQKPETVQVEIPSYPGSVITLLKRLPLQQAKNIASKYPKASKGDLEEGYKASLEQLVYAIKEWNLAESDKKLYDINETNIADLLSDPDVLLLGAILQGQAKQIEGTKWQVMKEEEKKS